MKKMLWLMAMLQGWGMAESPGHADAEIWLGRARPSEQGRKVIPGVIRLKYEPGWHGYWINPGEGGVKTTIRWKLPPGVVVTDLQFPVPHRAMTGELACYGYEGEVCLSFEMQVDKSVPPTETIVGQLRWLACNDQSCVPGERQLAFRLLEAGKDPAREQEIQKIHREMPRLDSTVRWSVQENGQELRLQIEGQHQWELEGTEFFPVTEQALDPKKPMRWKKTAAGYEAVVKKNEYAEGELRELILLIVPLAPQRPRWIEWKKS